MNAERKRQRRHEKRVIKLAKRDRRKKEKQLAHREKEKAISQAV